jgi:D-alanyl-D-alanine carboxypeptidase
MAILTALASLSTALGTTHGSRARDVPAPGFSITDGNTAKDNFIRRVYEAQVELAVGRGGTFFPGLPEDRLNTVEAGYRMRRDAAEHCRLLLKQARADLKRQQEEGVREALEVSGVGVFSAYRSIEHDRAAWRGAFEKYFKATKDERARLKGGEYGNRAVALMVNIMWRYKAAPGFSKHTSGMAVDFKTTEGGVTFVADSNQNGRWEKTWFHKWLAKNAKRFKFGPLATEAWHWVYTG